MYNILVIKKKPVGIELDLQLPSSKKIKILLDKRLKSEYNIYSETKKTTINRKNK